MLRRVCVLLLVLACSATTAEARGLTVSTVKDPVRQIQTGARLRVEYSVRNTGTATAKASTARVALVRGRTVIALTNGRVPRLAARKAKALAVSAVVPARATGAYRVRVCVGTNCRQSRRAVTVTVAAPVPPAPVPPPPAPVPIPAPVSADTTPPQAPTLSVSGLEGAAMTGSTLYYRAGGSGTFTVAADDDADVARVDFATLGQGWVGGGSDTSSPFSATYRFSPLSANASPVTAVAFDAARNASSPVQLSVVGDGTEPTVTLHCEPDDCTNEVSLSATDVGSGVASILYSLDGSEPSASYDGTPFLASTDMPLRAWAVDRVGNIGPELTRNIGPPPAQFRFGFGDESVNAAGDSDSRAAWIRPGVAGSLRVTALDLDAPSAFTWPQLGTGWTVEPDFDTAVYSFTPGAAPPLLVRVEASTDTGPRESFFRLRSDGTPPAAPVIVCTCDTDGVEIALSASDADSGVREILYSLDGSEPNLPYAGRFRVYASGTLRTRAVDRVGNAGPIATRTIVIEP